MSAHVGPTAPLHERLMARHPLPSAEGRARAAEGLAQAAEAYAARASHCGSRGPWWRVWRAIERARGHRLKESLATLGRESRRWLALWSFERGRVREGVRVYRAYVAAPGGIGPFDRENATYLAHVADREGPAAVVREGDALAAKTTQTTRVELLVLDALLALGDEEGLRARCPFPQGQAVHDGDVWARRAIACARLGDAAGAEVALSMCAKLGVSAAAEASHQARLLDALGLSIERWHELRAPWAPPEGELADLWRVDPGLRPAPASAPSPHCFGGDDVAMPDCPGCGHRMHAFFVVDVAEVAELSRRIPDWTFLPLVGCIDCVMWLTRRDFLVGRDARTVTILDPLPSPALRVAYGRTYGEPQGPLPRQPVRLVPLGADAEPGSDEPQIAGQPDWAQDFERAFCPGCHDEMVFVGAMGSTRAMGFFPEITINNGSGSQYHFACNPCRVLSVFGQNT